MSKTRVYARKIVPFLVLFSVVALRAVLVLVSVGSGCELGVWQWREREQRVVEIILEGNITNLFETFPFLVVWRGGGVAWGEGIECVVVYG